MNLHSSMPTTDVKRKCSRFSSQVTSLVTKLPSKAQTKDLGFKLVKATATLNNHIVNAQTAKTTKDLKQSYKTALQTTNETRYWLTMLRSRMPKSQPIVDNLLAENTEIAQLLGATIKQRNLKLT